MSVHHRPLIAGPPITTPWFPEQGNGDADTTPVIRACLPSTAPRRIAWGQQQLLLTGEPPRQQRFGIAMATSHDFRHNPQSKNGETTRSRFGILSPLFGKLLSTINSSGTRPL